MCLRQPSTHLCDCDVATALDVKKSLGELILLGRASKPALNASLPVRHAFLEQRLERPALVA